MPLVALLLAALALRLWGARWGLPFAYNSDEDAHFVPGAIGLFGHGWNPHYFVNPPAFTYLLHGVFAVAWGGGDGAGHAYATDPTAVFTVARVTSAVLGTASLAALYVAGERLFDRAAGLLAAAVMAVAFLPVFYSHLALNDVPATLGVCLALAGAAAAPRTDRAWPWLLAGAGVGLAAATKYTGGIALVPVLATALVVRSPRGALLALAGTLVGFLIANPYALLDLHRFRADLSLQKDYSSGSLGAKLGIGAGGGFAYYAWTLTWGFGWVPALAALGGAVHLLVRDRARALVLLPGPVLFLAYMGTQERYFGRWLLPILPILALLAAHGAVALARAVPARGRAVALAVAALALVAQGAWDSVRSDRALSRADTRNQVRAWLVAHVPAGSRIVYEPIVPAGWLQDPGAPRPRWSPWHFRAGTSLVPVRVEDFERALFPRLVRRYRRQGFCWVITGSTQEGRAEAQPDDVPRAVAYYRTLRRRSRVVARFSPYHRGAGPVKFNFDWSFDYFPSAFAQPGDEVVVHRLLNCHPYSRIGT